MPNRIRAVLFDAVGTLFYPDPPVADVYFYDGQSSGSRLTKHEIATRFNQALKSCFPNESGNLRTSHLDEQTRWRRLVASVFHDVNDVDESLFPSLWSHFSRSENWSVYEDVHAAWQELNSAGMVIGIASNFDDRLESICRGLEPLQGCRHVFWSARIGYAKPSPHFFRAIERELRLLPEEILFVGDHPINDLQGGQAAGWRTMLIDRDGNYTGSNVVACLTRLTDLIR